MPRLLAIPRRHSQREPFEEKSGSGLGQSIDQAVVSGSILAFSQLLSTGMDHLEAEVSKLKQQRKRSKQEEECVAIEDDLACQLQLLRPSKRVNQTHREYTHDTSVRTISKVSKPAKAKRKPGRVPPCRDTVPFPPATGMLLSSHSLLYPLCCFNVEDHYVDSSFEFAHDQPPEREDAVSRNQRRLDDLLQSIDVSITDNQPKTDWRKRMDTRDENWEAFRSKLFEEVVMYSSMPADSACFMCGDETPKIRCHQCGASQYMCHTCDETVHKHQPLHDREMWCDGVFRAIPPTSIGCEANSEQLSTQRVCIPFSIPWRCPLCKIGTLKLCPKESKKIVVNLRGRFDLNDVLPICDHCAQEIHLETPHDVIREQCWPGNPTRKSTHVFDTDLFLFYDLLKKHNPGLSELGFLRTLEQFSVSKGRVGSLNPATFGKAFREWRYCQFSIDQLKHSPQFECPCCTPEQHSVHFDGNKKLYRYSKVPRGSSSQYYEGFIVPNEEVDKHLDVIGYFGETTESDGLCGTTRWKAAKAVSKTMANLDETGLEVAGCRHALALKAINMFRGEIFGYPHYLHTKNFSEVKCVWADVICQYWPWALLKVDSCPEAKEAMSSQPCLSVMHAKAHSWHCQVLWGGRWQPNSAAGAGEEMEQLFSYLSRFNFTTKYMNAAGREEQLTEAVLFWNDRKISSLPSYLKSRLKKTRHDLGELKKELLLLQDKLGKDLSPEYCKQCCQEVQAIAKRESSGDDVTFDPEQQKVDYFELKSSVDTAIQLQPLVRGSNSAMSILTGNEQLFVEAEKLSPLLCNSDYQRRMSELKSMIVQSNDISLDQVDIECEKAAARAATCKFKERMELIYLTAQRRHANIQKLSTTSKQRAKLRKAISNDHKKLKKMARQYNDHIHQYNLELPQAVEDDILSGHFPWSSLSSRSCVSVQEKYQISTLYNQIERLKEEESLLLLEMTQYLMYFKHTIPEKLICDIQGITTEIHGIVESPVLSSDDGLSQSCSTTTTTSSSCSEKYTVLNKNKQTLDGLLAIKRSGLSDAAKRLTCAVQEFKNELAFTENDQLAYLMIVEDDDSESDSDD